MQLNQLEQFLVAAELEHMSKAADRLHISQPALSMNIRRLEEEIGVPLFDRNGRGICLNSAGRGFMEDIRQVMNDLDNAVLRARKSTGCYKEVTVFASSLPELSRYIVSSLPQSFDPSSYNCVLCNRNEQREKLLTGEIDFSLTIPPFSEPIFDWRPADHLELLLIVPKTHRLASRQRVSVRELTHETIVTAVSGYELHDFILQMCATAGFKPKLLQVDSDPELFAALVSRESGVCFIGAPKWTEMNSGAYNPLSNDLLAIPLEESYRFFDIGIATVKTRTLSIQAQNIIDYIINYLHERTSRILGPDYNAR